MVPNLCFESALTREFMVKGKRRYVGITHARGGVARGSCYAPRLGTTYQHTPYTKRGKEKKKGGKDPPKTYSGLAKVLAGRAIHTEHCCGLLLNSSSLESIHSPDIHFGVSLRYCFR